MTERNCPSPAQLPSPGPLTRHSATHMPSLSNCVSASKGRVQCKRHHSCLWSTPVRSVPGDDDGASLKQPAWWWLKEQTLFSAGCLDPCNVSPPCWGQDGLHKEVGGHLDPVSARGGAWPGGKNAGLQLRESWGEPGRCRFWGILASLNLSLLFCEMVITRLNPQGCWEAGRRSGVLRSTLVMAKLASFHQMTSWALQTMEHYARLLNSRVPETQWDLLTSYSQCAGRLGGGECG